VKKVDLTLYNKNVLEKELDNWSQKHNINFVKKKNIKKLKNYKDN